MTEEIPNPNELCAWCDYPLEGLPKNVVDDHASQEAAYVCDFCYATDVQGPTPQTHLNYRFNMLMAKVAEKVTENQKPLEDSVIVAALRRVGISRGEYCWLVVWDRDWET